MNAKVISRQRSRKRIKKWNGKLQERKGKLNIHSNRQTDIPANKQIDRRTYSWKDRQKYIV